MKITTGQHSDRGRKEVNQDFHGIYIPLEPQLGARGIAVALADGISSSEVSQVASQAAVTAFLEDYYCTSDAWSVRTSAERILSATNSWLHAQSRRSQHPYDRDKGYVCTLSAMVLKSRTAHIFHVGDARIYRVHGNALEQLTTDHRAWMGQGQSHLSRALGVGAQLEIDYHAFQLEPGDVFVLATDGVYEHADAKFITGAIAAHPGDLDGAAAAVVREALQRGSADNLTIQIVRIDALPDHAAGEMHHEMAGLPFPPILEPRMEFDGYRIVRELHGSSRSHVYLAVDLQTGAPVSIKTPSIDLQGDAAYIERFLTEEWIARRLDSPHVLRPAPQQRKRNSLYLASEYIEGQTLAQWMIDNPRPTLEQVRVIVEQVARGLRAFHRMEMLHQDLRPANILIDRTGTVKIIDFGSTRVASIMEAAPPGARDDILGTAQYTAPEYFLGEAGTARSDIFSLGVITYQMLTGKLPYGAQVARSRSRAAQSRLRYASVLDDDREIPAWIDGVLKKAVHPNPARRHEEVSEFAHDLRHPSAEFLGRKAPPLIERNPLAFWKGVSLVLALVVVLLLGLQAAHR